MISLEIHGTEEVVARFGAISPKLHLRLVKAMERAMIRLQAYVKSAKLSGQVLHVRTGALRRSIGETVADTDDAVTGKVGIIGGPTVIYGRAHEFGFEGVVSVKEHLRTIKEAFGRAIAPVDVTVRAHSRHMRIPERSFLRSSFTELRAGIVAALQDAVREAVRA